MDLLAPYSLTFGQIRFKIIIIKKKVNKYNIFLPYIDISINIANNWLHPN